MSDRAGGMDEWDVDERFASIVSQWDSPLPTAEDAQDTVADQEDDPVHDAETDAKPAAAPPAVGEASEAGDRPGDDVADPPETPTAEPPEDPEPFRPSSVNPSPIHIIIPTNTWRAAEPTPPTAHDVPDPAGGDSDDEEHFEPPAVRLPPQEDLHFWGALLGLVAGPLLLLYVAMARPFHSTRWFIVSVVVSVAGFALLVLRQPSHRDPTSGDNGARV